MSLRSLSLQALGTTATLCVSEERALAPAQALLERELAEIDAACSRCRPDSELARLNAASGRPLLALARESDRVPRRRFLPNPRPHPRRSGR